MHSFLHTYIHTYIYKPIYPYHKSIIPFPFIHPHIRPFIISFLHPLIRSLFDLFIHFYYSLTHLAFLLIDKKVIIKYFPAKKSKDNEYEMLVQRKKNNELAPVMSQDSVRNSTLTDVDVEVEFKQTRDHNSTNNEGEADLEREGSCINRFVRKNFQLID